jgi:hypothetical protein
MKKIFAFLTVILLAAAGAEAQVAEGGTYRIDQTVIASGGGTSADAGNLYKVEGTAGQAVAGASANTPYAVTGGFWSGSQLAPTAANAAVTGRVADLSGAGLRSVTVTLTGGALTAPRATRTNTFGNFSFTDLEVGQTYVVSVAHRRYGFAQSSYIFTLMEDLGGLVFQASWEN